MAHSDRDNERNFWKRHFRWDRETGMVEHMNPRRDAGARCWCYNETDQLDWINPYRYESGVPSFWNRDQRQAERSKLRQQMRRARTGRVDYDELPAGDGRLYRRPYYW